MSRTLNKVMLIGNVGKDPELKHTPSGIPVISFRLATSDSWKDREGNLREHTDWHTIVAWRGLAEVIHKLVQKGTRIYVEGKIQTRTFEDRNNNRRHVVEVLADNMLLLDNRKPREKTQDNQDKKDQDDDYEDSDSNYSDDDYKEYNKNYDYEDKKKNKDIPF